MLPVKEKNRIDTVLLITLTNIGDVVITTSVLSALRQYNKDIKVDMVLGPNARDLFVEDPRIDSIYIYDKFDGWNKKVELVRKLRKKKYDLILDLRESGFPFLLRARRRSGVFSRSSSGIVHMHLKHLSKLRKAGIPVPDDISPSLHLSAEVKRQVDTLLGKNSIKAGEEFVVMSPGSKSNTKKWPAECFADLSMMIFEKYGLKTVLVGDKNDASVSEHIAQCCAENVIDLTASTSLPQLAEIISRGKCLVSNDSAPLHIAMAVDTFAIAIFGPSDPRKYGPLPLKGVVFQSELDCVPCEKARCEYGRDCLKMISPEDVFSEFQELSSNGFAIDAVSRPAGAFPERIVVFRTDRIGDVLLSTPVFEAIKKISPATTVAAVVAPHAKPIVEGSPFVDEVLVYDKKGVDKGLFGSLRFAKKLRERSFDAALVLHSTNRSVLLPWLAGIPVRIGYKRRLSFLLSKGFDDIKVRGEIHERDYNLLLLKEGFALKESLSAQLYFPLKKAAQTSLQKIIRSDSPAPAQYIVLHPGASCVSKLWPVERFCKLAQMITSELGYKVIIVGQKFSAETMKALDDIISDDILSMADRLSLDELAWLIKDALLFVSNDSGPVHLSTAVNTPCISIFGRKQKGLSPVRWSPVGGDDVYFHKDSGCEKCAAHECVNGFRCLHLISVDEVFFKVKEMTQGHKYRKADR